MFCPGRGRKKLQRHTFTVVWIVRQVQFMVIGVYRDGLTGSTVPQTHSFRHLVDCTWETNPCQESLHPEIDRRLLTVFTIFSKLFNFLLILVCASWGAFPNACHVFYRKPFFYVFTRIRRSNPDFICIRICFSLLYYCTFNNKPSTFLVDVYLLFAVYTAQERALLL